MLPRFFFCFPRAGEFSANSPFDPSIHLTVSYVQADALVDPTCFRVYIKCSKTYPFHVGYDIYVGQGNSLVGPVVALGNFLALRGPSPWPLFCYADGCPLIRQLLSSTVQSILHSPGHNQNWIDGDVIQLSKMAPTRRDTMLGHFSALF